MLQWYFGGTPQRSCCKPNPPGLWETQPWQLQHSPRIAPHPAPCPTAPWASEHSDTSLAPDTWPSVSWERCFFFPLQHFSEPLPIFSLSLSLSSASSLWVWSLPLPCSLHYCGLWISCLWTLYSGFRYMPISMNPTMAPLARPLASNQENQSPLFYPICPQSQVFSGAHFDTFTCIYIIHIINPN